jgi:hypothetical protein
MPREFNPLIRAGGFQEAEKLFVLAFEGEVTEKKYFQRLRKSPHFNPTGLIETVPLTKPPFSGNDPISLAKLLKAAKKEYRFKKTDEFWLIVDRDDWATIHRIDFNQLIQDFDQEGNFHLALSNPCFEVWFLLHYVDLTSCSPEELTQIEQNPKVGNKKYTSHRVASFSENGYSKNPPSNLCPRTKLAIHRAKLLDLANERYPSSVGTHVYKLVEKLIQ